MAVASLSFIDPKDVTLGKLLGAGGFGEVYKATHVNWGTVAVKQLRGVTLADGIKKEAEKMWRVISSPFLVRIMGILQDPEGLGIVMEYFENGSLHDFQRKYMQCECWSRKVKMIQDVALGMNYLHTLKPPIIHRDLKVENLFVGDGFEAKIGDFGLAVSSKTSRQVSRVSGTRSHIPPEASTNPSIQPDEFWDIYTFAITTYELTSGRDAWPQQQTFANDTLISVWVLQGYRPDLKAIPPEAPEEIFDIIKQCWVAEPKERPRFQDILRTVTELFEKKYKGGIRKADRAILEQMDLVQESAKASEHSSAADSNVDSFWGKFEAMDINETKKEASSIDSGNVSESSRGSSEQPPPLPPKKQAVLPRASSPIAAGIDKSTDLKQDMLTLEVMQIMDNIWQEEGLDLRVIPYKALNTGSHSEIVTGAQTIAEIHKKGGVLKLTHAHFLKTSLFNWLKKNNKTEDDLTRAIHDFTYSCAGYCVATYVLGIGDWHSDNIMIKETGQLFHINFGHFLGEYKTKFGIKREHVPIVLAHEFIHVITRGKHNTQAIEEFENFRKICEETFMILRRRSDILITRFATMFSRMIQELSDYTSNYLGERLVLDKGDDDARKHFHSKFNEALKNSWKTSINWMMHEMAK